MNKLNKPFLMAVAFIAGLFVSRIPVVKAQVSASPVIVIPVGPGVGTPVPADARVVGFSCISDGQCYLAVQR